MQISYVERLFFKWFVHVITTFPNIMCNVYLCSEDNLGKYCKVSNKVAVCGKTIILKAVCSIQTSTPSNL
jgi:hypothetical protein